MPPTLQNPKKSRESAMFKLLKNYNSLAPLSNLKNGNALINKKKGSGRYLQVPEMIIKPA